MNGTMLEQTSEYKYLGVTITSNLSWKPHITNLCNRTRRTIGLLYRNFYQHLDASAMIKLYLSFVRPQVEYSSQVWSPHHIQEVEALENVQKFALKMCTKSWDSNYKDLLNTNKVQSLEARRIEARLFKIRHGLTSNKHQFLLGNVAITQDRSHQQL